MASDEETAKKAAEESVPNPKLYKSGSKSVPKPAMRRPYAFVWKEHWPFVVVPIIILVLGTPIYVLQWWFLKKFSLRAWTVSDFKTIMDAFAWHHVLALTILLCLLMFRRSIGDYLHSIIKASIGAEGLSLEREPSLLNYEWAQAVQITAKELNPDQRLTVDYVATRMAEMELVGKESLKDSSLAHSYFLRNGITTKSRFDDLLNSEYIMDMLARVYREVFPKRSDSPAPLDPVAIATWGTYLWKVGPEEAMLEHLRQVLRETPEGRGLI